VGLSHFSRIFAFIHIMSRRKILPDTSLTTPEALENSLDFGMI